MGQSPEAAPNRFRHSATKRTTWEAAFGVPGGPATNRDSSAHGGAARGRASGHGGGDLSTAEWLVPAMSGCVESDVSVPGGFSRLPGSPCCGRAMLLLPF